jgi:hypothetical protein
LAEPFGAPVPVFGALLTGAGRLPPLPQRFLLALRVPSRHRNRPLSQPTTPPFLPEHGLLPFSAQAAVLRPKLQTSTTKTRPNQRISRVLNKSKSLFWGLPLDRGRRVGLADRRLCRPILRRLSESPYDGCRPGGPRHLGLRLYGLRQ